MSNVQAVILAAGRGSRLGSSGDEVPKCLLEIGRRRLIEHQLDLLAEAGVGPVHIVLGYGAEEVREIVGRRAEFLVNTRWEATNSIYSFWLVREKVQGDIVLLNCDVLFAPEVLERLLDCPGSALAIDTHSGHGREQMKVSLDGGRVVGMAKDLPLEQVGGENVGVLKLTAADARVAFDHAGRLIGDGGERGWVGAAITELARERVLSTVDVAGLPWVEIDFPVDLIRARNEVWPEIRGKTYRKRRRRQIAALAILAGLVIGTAAALPYLTRPEPPPPSEWVTLVFDDLYEERVTIGEQSQNWWVLEADRVAEVVVHGPDTVRLETRLIDRPSEQEAYVLEVMIDGEAHDWYKLLTRPSTMATHPTLTISHKKRVAIEIPEGRHTLGVRLLAPRDTDCLVRVRQPDVDTEDMDPQ